jgi:hypothetical protein
LSTIFFLLLLGKLYSVVDSGTTYWEADIIPD